jgi:hypothetical protein
MTRPEDPVGDLPPADELDELASALLDAAARDDDLARAADPTVAAELARRRARFERVRAVLSEPVEPVAAEARDAAIAAALAAADERPAADEHPAADEAGDDLAVARSRRAEHRSAGLRVLGAAAAVLAVVALGAAVLAGGRGDDADSASDTGDSAEEAGEGGMEASLGGDDAASPESDDGAGSALPVLGDLGDFGDVDALLDAIGGERQFEGTTSDISDDVVAREVACAREVDAGGELGVLVATASVRGDAVAVWMVDDGRTVVVELASCAVLSDTDP